MTAINEFLPPNKCRRCFTPCATCPIEENRRIALGQRDKAKLTSADGFAFYETENGVKIRAALLADKVVL